jgi:hypothetical protein
LALLNIGKKKEPEQPPEVPDELPDLPQEAENTVESAADAQEQVVPDELPPVAELPAELAPDELPPVSEVGADLEAPSEAVQGVDDKRLYFSQLLQKLHDEGLKSTKLTTPTANLFADMKKHWKVRKRSDEIDDMNRQLQDSINPLQKLEQEWVSLSDEIDAKKKALHEKEEQIKQFAEDLKRRAVKVKKLQEE